MILTRSERSVISSVAENLPAEIVAGFNGVVPVSASLACNLATALVYAGEDALAERRFRQAVLLAPESVAAAAGLLGIYGAAGRVPTFERSLLDLFGTSADWRRYGRDLARRGMVEHALSALDKAAAGSPLAPVHQYETALYLWSCFRDSDAVRRLLQTPKIGQMVKAFQWLVQDDLETARPAADVDDGTLVSVRDAIMDKPVRDPEVFRQQVEILLLPHNKDRFPRFVEAWPHLVSDSELRDAALDAIECVGPPHEWMAEGLVGACPVPDIFPRLYRVAEPRYEPVHDSAFDGDAIDSSLAVSITGNAEVLTGDWVVLEDGRNASFESCHSFLARRQDPYGLRVSEGWLSVRSSAQAVASDAPAVLIGASANYYHWMIDFLPKLLALKAADSLADRKVIMPGNVEPFALEIINKLGIPHGRWLLVDFPAVLSVPDLASVRFQARRKTRSGVPVIFAGGQSPEVIAALRSRLFGLFGLKDRGAGHRRLFVSRKDSRNARLRNEAEIFEALTPLGFEKVCLKGMDVAAQAELFAEARVVVGAHGAGLTNTLFMPADAALFELHDRYRHLDYFEQIAGAVGVRYRPIASSRTFVDQGWRQRNKFSLDPRTVVRHVQAELDQY